MRIIALAAALLALSAPAAWALSVETAGTYSYGDYLSLTITVDEVTGGPASFWIIDSQGGESSAVQVAVTEASTTVTAAAPFSSPQFAQGPYTIRASYGGQSATAGFVLEDSGKKVVPFWLRDVAALWLQGTVADWAFLNNMIDNGVIDAEPAGAGDGVRIPAWLRANAGLWLAGSISGQEFAGALQYIVSERIIYPG